MGKLNFQSYVHEYYLFRKSDVLKGLQFIIIAKLQNINYKWRTKSEEFYGFMLKNSF